MKVGAAEGEIAPIRVQRPLLLPYPLDIADPLTQKLVEQTPEMQMFANNVLRAPDLPFGKAENRDRWSIFWRVFGQRIGPWNRPVRDRRIAGAAPREIAKLVAPQSSFNSLSGDTSNWRAAESSSLETNQSKQS